MKLSGAKFLFLFPFAFCSLAAKANLYRINLTYDADETESGSLSGFLIIDTSSIDFSVANNTNALTTYTFPSWITEASLTISGAVSNNGTYTTFDSMVWAIDASANGGTFDPASNFKNQMFSFGLGSQASDRIFSLPPTGSGQEFEQGASPLEVNLSATSTIPTPGPLPLLGLIPLGFYYRKLKKKSYNL